MKKVLLLVMVLVSVQGFSQDFAGLDKSALDAAYYPEKAAKRKFAIGEKKKMALTPKIRVLYSRPTKREREIFGGLVKFDKPWRVGANESTEILFMTDVKIGEKEIKAGRYSIIIIPTAKSWTMKLNSQLDGWGNYSYDEAYNVASLTANVQRSSDEIEALSIVLYEKVENLVHLKIGWDHTIVEFPIVLK